MKMLLKSRDLPDNTLANLDNRDVALWVRELPWDPDQRDQVIAFLGLPWRLVLLEGRNPGLIEALEAASNVDDHMARKRGLMQIVDSDPSRIQLPPRCLPVYLLDDQRKGVVLSPFEKRLRRINMLEEFRQSSVREVLFISGSAQPIPVEFSDIWLADYRAQLTFVSGSLSAETQLNQWLEATPDITAVTLVEQPTEQLTKTTLVRYLEVYPADRRIIRMRDNRGQFHRVDITTADEVERPILETYDLIQERNVMRLQPDELNQEEFVDFFKDPEHSWRPYAAGLPWVRDASARDELRRLLRRLDSYGPDENCIAYIASEPGSGGTTLARLLAWESARDGYPVLMAKQFPFVPDALPIVNYITNANRLFGKALADEDLGHGPNPRARQSGDQGASEHHFETPWVIVFDTLHWQHRDTELLQFRNELTASGRPACVLVVAGTELGLPYWTSAAFKKLTELNHAIEREDALALGRHLNQYLRYYGRARTEAQWERFYNEHTIRYLEGIAAFWVTLSFWIQGQYDLSESIQEWIYRAFREQADDPIIQEAILQIAAMSSERLPLPQAILPRVSGRWPVWQLIEDRIAELGRIGLTQINAQGQRYWALVHDILGRLLINALFYDYPTREVLGYADANSPEELRFLLLRGISQNPRLGEKAYIAIGEDFATEVFKVDPDHGKSSFADIWRQVLEALDRMPQLLRDTSRVFRHHSAISRRRIAKLDPLLYGVGEGDKKVLLTRAIADINYALTEIPYSAGSEPDLNLLNSLAHAYFDLAEVESMTGAPPERVAALRRSANEATLRAYHESPNNSFVVETYVRSLLQVARDVPDRALENCIAALGVVYSALNGSIENARTSQLGKLADQTLKILLQQVPSGILASEPHTAIDVLVRAWLVLASERSDQQDWSMVDVPLHAQETALEVLGHPAGRGNMQVLHLRYDLTCNCRPYHFKDQIRLLEPLRLSQYWISPQLQLEYAILLFQVGRPTEGDREFRSLRRLWQKSEQFVAVPPRLRWLRAADGKSPQLVRATNGSDYGTRAFALVREFANARVPFRPEEHGFSDPQPGVTFSCYVSFGHNGPFLRPLSSPPPPAE